MIIPQKKIFGKFSRIRNQLTFTAVLFLFGISLTICVIPTVAHGPQAWKVPAKEKKRKNPILDTAESRRRGQTIYADKCALCHGLKGEGQGEMGKALEPRPPDFADRHMMKKMTDGEIFWKITTGKGPMPSYEKELTEPERWDLVNYIRSLAKGK